MVWLDIAVSFCIAMLSGLGVGSGGLLVIYLTLLSQVPQLQAQGINLVFFLFSAGSSMLSHLWRRHLILPLCILMIACGIPGALAGSYLAGILPAAALRRLFGGFLVIAGGLTLTRNAKRRASFGIFHKPPYINR
ncbi:MAG: sulfite exporter TauE/SafE family protein [Ruminococcaceae bacterium]|nr:sulfite exporter TauE/SafE family protein [Oscillospiraceae bacterium]